MLTKSQASAAADALLEANKARHRARLDARVARIPIFYRSPFLARLPAWRQAQLIGDACASGNASGWTPVIFFVCIVWLCAVAWFASDHVRLGAICWLAFPPIAALAELLRRMRIKLKLQELLLRELSQSTESAASTDEPVKESAAG